MIISVSPGSAASAGVSKAGPRGKGWVIGEGAPTDDKGANGEMYFDTVAHVAYGPKTGGTWTGTPVANYKEEADIAVAARNEAVAARDTVVPLAAQVTTDAGQVTTDKGIVNTAKNAAVTAAGTATSAATTTTTARDVTLAARDAAITAKEDAEEAEIGAAASAALADADATATAADRIAVAADRVQTAADRVQTGLDRAAAEAAAGALTTVPVQIVAAATDTTPVDADLFGWVDVSASNALKKFTWANLKTALGSVFQAASSKLTTLAGQTWAADRFTYYTSASAAAIGTITSFGRSLIDDADAAAARTTLALTSLATSLFATQAEAEAKTSTTVVMSPLRTAQAMAAPLAAKADLVGGKVPVAQLPVTSSHQLLATVTASASTSLLITDIDPTPFRQLVLEFEGLTVSTSVSLRMELSGDNGSTFGTVVSFAGSMVTTGGAATGLVIFRNPWETTLRYYLLSALIQPNGNNAAINVTDTTAILPAGAFVLNAIRLTPTSGNFPAGTFRLYGVK